MAAATAPAKEAVYEEATSKNPPIKDELHLKKLSDYKTLSKVPKYLVSSQLCLEDFSSSHDC